MTELKLDKIKDAIRARKSPSETMSVISRGKHYSPWHIQVLNDKLLEMTERKLDRLIVTMPPRHGKSTMISYYFPTWYLGTHPDHRVMLASYEAELAASWGSKVRDALTAYGEDLFDITVNPASAAKDRWDVLDHDGGMVCVGVGGPLTGRGCDLMIIDDYIKNSEEARSQIIREKHWDWWTGTASTRLEPGAITVVLATRWHGDDLIGRLIDADPIGWEVIHFPAIATHDEEYRKEGEALWPARFDVPALRRIQKRSPFWFCTPAETPILMSDWSYKPISQVAIGDQVVGFERPQGQRRVITVATVTDISVSQQQVQTMEMESGHRVRCTADHRWWKRVERDYSPAKVGSTLRRIPGLDDPEPSARQRELWQYLAGIVDGEGHITRSYVNICQVVPRNQPVVDRIRETLVELQLPFTEWREASTNTKWGDRVCFNLLRVGYVYRMLLNHTMLAKRDQALAMLSGGTGMGEASRDQVIAITQDGVEPVYGLTTTTGNYVAWGLWSSNSAEYQGNPSSEEGDVFKRHGIRYWRSGKATTLDGEIVDGYLLKQLNGDEVFVKASTCWRFITCDLAASERESADYTVFQVWAVTPQADMILLDQIRGRMPGPEKLPALKGLIARYDVSYAGIEKAGFQLDFIQNARWAGLPVFELTPKGDKMGRAIEASVRWEAGQVYLPSNEYWVSAFIEEVCTFDHAPHDDQVDALSYAAIEVSRRGFSPSYAFGLHTCHHCGQMYTLTARTGLDRPCPYCHTPPIMDAVDTLVPLKEEEHDEAPQEAQWGHARTQVVHKS